MQGRRVGRARLEQRDRLLWPARAQELIPKHLELRTLLELDREDNERLKEDLNTCKISCTGGKDEGGRAILWIRLRFHEPKKSKALDMGRLLYTIMIEALKDVDVQRCVPPSRPPERPPERS